MEASSSKGAFFHHFSCKRDLDQALVAVGDADLGMLHEGLKAAAGVDEPTEKVLAFLRFYETWAGELVSADSTCVYIAVVTERNLLDDVSSAETSRDPRWREGFGELLEPARRDSGGASPIDVTELADHLFAASRVFSAAFLAGFCPSDQFCRCLLPPPV